MQILVVAPQRDEFQHLIDGLRREDCRIDRVQFGSIEGATTPEHEITIAIGGHGKAQFAAQTQYLISRVPDIELVVCAGAAGSLVEQLSLGDVVVSTGTIEHDYKLRFEQRPPPVHFGHAQTIEQLRTLVRTSDLPFRVHFGGIACGDEDIIDRVRADALHAETDAVCVAWEGSGGARAAALNQLPFLEVRVITDSADDSACTDFHTNLAKTIPNITSLLIRWLRSSAA